MDASWQNAILLREQSVMRQNQVIKSFSFLRNSRIESLFAFSVFVYFAFLLSACATETKRFSASEFRKNTARQTRAESFEQAIFQKIETALVALELKYTTLQKQFDAGQIGSATFDLEMQQLKKKLTKVRAAKQITPALRLRICKLKSRLDNDSRNLACIELLKKCWLALNKFYRDKKPVEPEFLQEKNLDAKIDELSKLLKIPDREKKLLKAIFAFRLHHFILSFGLLKDGKIRKFDNYAITKSLGNHKNPKIVSDELEQLYAALTIATRSEFTGIKQQIKKCYKELVVNFGSFGKFADNYSDAELGSVLDILFELLKIN